MESSSNRQFGILGICAAFVLGSIATAGLWIGWSLWNSTPENLDEPTPDSRVQSSELSDVDSTSLAQADTHPDTLDEIAQLDTEFSRFLALYNFAMESTETDLLDLIDQTEKLADPLRFQLQKVFVDRLYEINPELVLSRAENFHSSLVHSIFRQQARGNLSNAIARAKSMEGEVREAAMFGILSHRPNIPPELQSEIARELGFGSLTIGSSQGQRVLESQRDHAKVWNEALQEGSYDNDHMRTLTIAAVSWVREEGLDVVDEISTSLDNAMVREQIIGSVFASAMHFMETEELFAKALEFESKPDGVVLPLVVGRWAAKDPTAALDAVNEVDSHLVRKQLQQMVVHNWAHNDPQSILDEIDRIPNDQKDNAQKYALRTIARSDPEEAISLTRHLKAGGKKTQLTSEIASIWAEEDPEAALAWILNNQEFQGGRSQVLSSVVKGWSRRDPSAALDWVLDLEESSVVRSSSVTTIIKNLADQNPQLALQRALEQPIEENRLGLELTVISHVARDDFQLARAMLQQTREGSTRVNSYVEVGSAMVAASHPNQALELASDLLSSDRTKYVSTILSRWVSHDAKGLLDSLVEMSDPEIQSSAAAMLIVRNEVRDILTEDQIEYARKYAKGNAISIIEQWIEQERTRWR